MSVFQYLKQDPLTLTILTVMLTTSEQPSTSNELLGGTYVISTQQLKIGTFHIVSNDAEIPILGTYRLAASEQPRLLWLIQCIRRVTTWNDVTTWKLLLLVNDFLFHFFLGVCRLQIRFSNLPNFISASDFCSLFLMGSEICNWSRCKWIGRSPTWGRAAWVRQQNVVILFRFESAITLGYEWLNWGSWDLDRLLRFAKSDWCGLYS